MKALIQRVILETNVVVFLLKTIVSFNSGKIKVEKLLFKPLKPYLSLFEMQKCNRKIVLKKKEILSITILVH